MVYIIMFGSTPVICNSKIQKIIASSTCEVDFTALKTAMEEIQGLCCSLQMMGIKQDRPTKILGENLAIVMNSLVPESKLLKKHHVIAYHLVREAVVAGICKIHHVDTKDNAANPLIRPSRSRTMWFWMTVSYTRVNLMQSTAQGRGVKYLREIW